MGRERPEGRQNDLAETDPEGITSTRRPAFKKACVLDLKGSKTWRVCCLKTSANLRSVADYSYG